MKQKNTKQLYIMSGILAVLILAGVGSIVLTHQKSSQISQSTKIVLTPTITPEPILRIDRLVKDGATLDTIDTSPWKTFTSSNGSFSYRYPSIGTKLGENNIAQASYLQFSERDSENTTDPYSEIAVAFDNETGYKGHIPTFDHIDKKDITIDGKKAHEDVFLHNGKISGIIIYFDEFVEKSTQDPMSNTYSSKKYGFGLIWIGIYAQNQNVGKYLLLSEKIISTLKFLK